MSTLDFKKQLRHKGSNTRIYYSSAIGLTIAVLGWLVGAKLSLAKPPDTFCYIKHSSGLMIDLTSYCNPKSKIEPINIRQRINLYKKGITLVSGSKEEQCKKFASLYNTRVRQSTSLVYNANGEVKVIQSDAAMKSVLASTRKFSKSLGSLYFEDNQLRKHQSELLAYDKKYSGAIQKYLDAKRKNNLQVATSIYLNSIYLSGINEELPLFLKLAMYCEADKPEVKGNTQQATPNREQQTPQK